MCLQWCLFELSLMSLTAHVRLHFGVVRVLRNCDALLMSHSYMFDEQHGSMVALQVWHTMSEKMERNMTPSKYSQIESVAAILKIQPLL